MSPWQCCHWGKLMLTWGILLLSVITVTVCTICYLLLNPCSALPWAEAIMAWVWKYFSTAPADIDMEPTSYPNNPINEPSHRIWFRFKFINSDWNGSWIGCLCFDYNRSLTKSITIDCNGVRSSIMIMKERRARVELQTIHQFRQSRIRGHSQMTLQHWTTNGNSKADESWRGGTKGHQKRWWMMKNPMFRGNPSKSGLIGSH